MSFKRNIYHPAFIIGLVSYLVLILAVVFRGYGYSWADYVFGIAVGLGAVHWIWSIIDVFSNRHLDKRSKPFWLILVMLIPPLGGMVYYAMKNRIVSI